MTDPARWFGIPRVVRHQVPFTPVDELDLWTPYFMGDPPASIEDLAARFAAVGRNAVDRWSAGKMTDDDVRILNWLLDQGVLSNQQTQPGVQELVAAYRGIEQRMPVPWTVNGLVDIDPGYDLPWLYRGEYDQFREPVPRGYLRALGGNGDGFRVGGSGRRELAERIATPENPLTARVFVNRAWHWLFGKGIVATPNDFGHAGDLPSHPELLDRLASDFTDHDWSLKRSVRRIVSSATWRQASQATGTALASDPENRLLHHYPLRRLEAEAIRDTLLAVSGRFDPVLYGPTVNPPRQNEDAMKRLFSGPLDGAGRRSVYTRVTVMEPPKFLALFNQPAPKIPTGLRDITNTPAQALTLLNDPFVKQQAEVWASRLLDADASQPQDRIITMFRTAWGRPPTTGELAAWTTAVQDFARLHGVGEEHVLTSLPVWTDIAHAVFNTKEFLYGF